MASAAVRPVYLVADVSPSMQRSIGHTGAVLKGVVVGLTGRDVRICVMQFAGRCRVLASLSEPDGETFFTLTPRPGTSFLALFRRVRNEVFRDAAQLESDGFRVDRPCLVLLTDGQATDAWEESHLRLVEYDPETGEGFEWHPTVMTVACGDPDEFSLARMRSPLTASGITAGADPDTTARAVLEALAALDP